jgi:hypothetical protein
MYRYPRSAGPLSLEAAVALSAAEEAAGEAAEVEAVEAFLDSAPAVGTYSHQQLPVDYSVPTVLLMLVRWEGL